ncbi:multicomponent Na+:H+ antiporter subunit F [Rhizobium sp. RU33A]|uniref:cation:proton antiporter n=1 Tax=Rhizobium sp. RU33A TaxID=1907413 RepID=UPI000956FDF4|nr:cation:proton antiporter [Rhizobium sp. RU33A]SIQ47262.1 multicomponent Na+:H+ antiporter subunit F [Rhizobium sp. RU33A]
MTPELIVEYASVAAIVILVVALLMTVYRAVVGPTLPDRVIALDMLVGIVIGFIAVIALRTGFTLYIDIAIALGLVGFLATVAFARFILARGRVGEGEEVEAGPGQSKKAAKTKAAKNAKASKPAAPLGKEAK